MLKTHRQSVFGIKFDVVLIVLCGVLVLFHSTKVQAENDAFKQLLDDIWQYELAQFPSIARSENLRPNVPLIDISMSAITARQTKFSEYLNQLNKIDENKLNASEKISLFMQRYRLQNYLDGIAFKAYRVPITSEYGFHSSLASTVSNFHISNKTGFEDYLALMDAIPAYIAQNIDYMREGMSVGHVQPSIVLVDYEDTISPYINTNVEEHPFFVHVKNIDKAILSTEKKETLLASLARVADAYQDFYTFFVDEYRPKAKRNIAATTWPSGKDFYDNRIRYYTTTDMSAEEIHNVGLKEVARIREEMQSIINALDFDGDIADFIHFLRNDPRFYAKTPKELIVTASYIAKQMDAKLPQLFYKMPRTPYGVAPVPDSIAPKYTTGRYISPRRNDQAGYYWVNTYALDKRPKYALPALTLHEAVPGHHFQISLAAEMDDLPKVRRSTYISAFGEGWGLYSEFLGLEVGIYEDPYDNFGRLSYEMWRACRLVVDTGMHVFAWSREKAINYMLENTALSEHNVRTEIDRYISWPAQALSYKIGEIKIKALRAKAEKALGENFDLRAFHDAILANGSVPLFVLETHIDQFIENNRFTE